MLSLCICLYTHVCMYGYITHMYTYNQIYTYIVHVYMYTHTHKYMYTHRTAGTVFVVNEPKNTRSTFMCACVRACVDSS